jgi:hypothetical protein
MSAEIAHELHDQTIEHHRSLRARIVLGLGPATILAGVVWALIQPYRLIFLHPHGEGFWWLVGGETPLFVVLAGIVFWRVVAIPLVKDLESGGLRGHGRVPPGRAGRRETASSVAPIAPLSALSASSSRGRPTHPVDEATPAEAAQ